MDLLSAALDWKHAFEEKSRLMKILAADLSSTQLDNLARFTADQFMLDPVKTNTTIALETERIRHTRKYNENRRAKKEKLEREAAIPTLQSPEDLEMLTIAKEAGFESFADYQDFLFNQAKEDTNGNKG